MAVVIKEKAILCTHIGELGWEILRFQPYVLWNKLHKYKGAKLIVHTRPDRFDLYGEFGDVFEPLPISNGTADCFTIKGMTDERYTQILNTFYEKYEDDYEIQEHIFPIITGPNFARKDQFHANKTP